MKTILVGSLVGAVILFGWQAFSWTASNIHDRSFNYSPNQDAVMQTLSTQLQSEGHYLIPTTKPGVSKEEKMKYNENMTGKPWAIVTYHQAHSMDMAGPMTRGFLTSFVCVLLVCLVLRRFDPMFRNFISVSTAVLTFGVVSFLFIWYNQHNWFETPWNFLWPEMIDNLVSWALVGLWLGWWYSRKNKRVTM